MPLPAKALGPDRTGGRLPDQQVLAALRGPSAESLLTLHVQLGRSGSVGRLVDANAGEVLSVQRSSHFAKPQLRASDHLLHLVRLGAGSPAQDRALRGLRWR